MSLPAILKGTCADCRVPGFDDTVGCATCAALPAGSLQLAGEVEALRMAWACVCTCIAMGFRACAVSVPIADCKCIGGALDGTTQAGSIITGAWFGWTDVASPNSLQELIDLLCPGPITMKVYGSNYDFGSHSTTTNLNCPTDTTGMVLLPIGGPGVFEITFAGGAPIENDDSGCSGGGFFLSATDLGIQTASTSGDGTDCSQEGGMAMLLAQFTDSCGNVSPLCPFAGPMGQPFNCVDCSMAPCCVWSVDPTFTSGGTFAILEIDATKPSVCCCDVTTTLNIYLNGVLVESHALSGVSFFREIDFPVTTPGDTITLETVNLYGAGAYCGTCSSGSSSQDFIV